MRYNKKLSLVFTWWRFGRQGAGSRFLSRSHGAATQTSNGG